MPIELIGEDGITKTIDLKIEKFQNAKILKILFYSLNYQDKGSIRINRDPWISLNHKTVSIEKKALARGGMERGAPASFYSFMPIKLSQKDNKISFRFNKSDGVSIGYRIVDIAVLDEKNKNLIATEQENVERWSAPPNADAGKGKALWHSAKLVSGRVRGGNWYAHKLADPKPITATCADCHVSDGRDLKMFAYSNQSIIERSKFHGLSEQQGKDIAAYIRKLPVSQKGRPWNPPYQPGPNIDLKHWYAGAGLEAVLADDEDMLAEMFPNGVNQDEVYKYFDNKKMADTSRTRLAIQLPDWKAYLPLVHPKDGFKDDYYLKSAAYNNYKAMAGYLSSKSDYPQRELWGHINRMWKGFRFFFEEGGKGDHWRTKNGTALKFANGFHSDILKTSMARLLAIHNFEFHQVHNLEMLGKKYVNSAENPRTNSWVGRWYNVFEIPPHFTSCTENVGCDNFIGQSKTAGNFESTSWYQLQQVINPGIGVSKGVAPVDYNYQPQFILRASRQSGIIEPMRFWYSQNVMFQTRVRTHPLPGQTEEGFNIRTMGPWTFLGRDNRSKDYGVNIIKATEEVHRGLARMFVNAQLRQWNEAMRHPANDLSKWARRDSMSGGETQYLESEKIAVQSAMPNLNKDYGGPTKNYVRKIYWSMPRFLELGVDCKEFNELKKWTKRAWPNVNWDQFNCRDIPKNDIDIKVDRIAEEKPKPNPMPKIPPKKPSMSFSKSKIHESNRFQIEKNGKWLNLICKNGKAYASESEESKWIKLSKNNGQKRSFVDEHGNKLYCKDGNEATKCICGKRNAAEKFHFKQAEWYNNQAMGHRVRTQLADGKIGYISSNNGFEACLKVLDKNEVHSPCNWGEPKVYGSRYQSRCRRQQNFSRRDHEKPCAKIKIPRCLDTGRNCG